METIRLGSHADLFAHDAFNLVYGLRTSSYGFSRPHLSMVHFLRVSEGSLRSNGRWNTNSSLSKYAPASPAIPRLDAQRDDFDANDTLQTRVSRSLDRQLLLKGSFMSIRLVKGKAALKRLRMLDRSMRLHQKRVPHTSDCRIRLSNSGMGTMVR